MGPDGEASGADKWSVGELPGLPAEARVAEGGRRVLVVEDDPDVGELAVTALEMLGYRVVLTSNALAALARIESEPHGFDLVFSDIVMPGGVSGIDLAVTLRARYPHLPVLLATGYSNAALSPAARHFPVLAKPYRLQELGQRVAELLSAHAKAG